MKNNPLFVDSTKFHGDLIATQVELRNVLIYDDEALFAIVTNHKGESKRLAMRPLDERGYEARIHLHHQTVVTYRFVIEKEGRAFMFSRAEKARAQYAIIADWEPSDEDPTTLDLSAGASQAPASTPSPNAWPREQAVGIRSLIDKWGF